MKRTGILVGLILVGLIWAIFASSNGYAQTATPDQQIDEATKVALPEDPAAVIAMVGNTPILLGDLMPKVQARIDQVVASAGQQVPEEHLQIARVNLVRGLLAQSIQNKMMRESFLLDQVGTQAADKRREAEATLASRARQMFFESEVPELKKQYKTDNLNELDKILREKGTSLASRQRDFIDQMLGHLYIRSKVDKKPEVSVAEIREHYLAHVDQYERPKRARWEQLSVMFSNFDTKEAAKKAIWNMGREAYFGGSMQAVARERSQEPFASKGGVHEWTAKGSLASDRLDQEIFSIPLDAMSEIIEDEQGYHIVRVLDRQEAGRVPLSEVQDEIRTAIRQDKIAKAQRKVMDDMQSRIPVWSLFPKDTPGANPLPESIAQRYRASTIR